MITSTEVSLSDISQHYNELDEFYRELWGIHLHHGFWISGNESKEEAVAQLSQKVLSCLGSLKGKKLMDIGCGYGETTRLSLQLGATQSYGITISEKQFEFARKHSQNLPVQFFMGDWLDNNFADETFDAAFSIECFEHFQNKQKYFEEVQRTLKNDGLFAMTSWLAAESPPLWEKKYILKPICDEGRLPSLCSRSEVEMLAESSGLEVIKFEDLSRQVSRTWSISSQEMMKLWTHLKGLRYFFNRENKERKFALAVLRIFLGYKTDSFKYGLFVMRKCPATI